MLHARKIFIVLSTKLSKVANISEMNFMNWKLFSALVGVIIVIRSLLSLRQEQNFWRKFEAVSSVNGMKWVPRTS